MYLAYDACGSQTEVSNFDLVIGVQKYVHWLQISVNHSLLK